MEIYKMILMAEEKMAREVTLGVIVTRPLKVWHNIIPGMFIAQALVQDEDKATVFSHIENETRTWLNSLDLYTPGLLQAQLAVIKLLVDHYAKLLKKDGYSVYALIQKAYENRVNFQGFIDELTAAEAEVDRELVAKMGETEKLRAKISAEQEQLKERREKIIEEVF
jgi:hypothetical protein